MKFNRIKSLSLCISLSLSLSLFICLFSLSDSLSYYAQPNPYSFVQFMFHRLSEYSLNVILYPILVYSVVCTT